MSNNEWKESTGTSWKPTEEGDSIEGLLIGVEEHVGQNDSKMYHIEQKDHATIDVWGSTVLDMRMAVVKIGEEVKIVYKGLGEKKRGNNAPKLFQVFHREPQA
jgi:hypothetical protein